eukprot:tig00000949_g5720.t1
MYTAGYNNAVYSPGRENYQYGSPVAVGGGATSPLMQPSYSASPVQLDPPSGSTSARLSTPGGRRETRTWLDQVRLFVKVVEARNLLRATPRGPRRNHGYVTVTYSGQGYQTKTIRNSETPRLPRPSPRPAPGPCRALDPPRAHDTIIEVELRSQQGEAPDRSDPILGVINLNFSNMKSNEAYRFWYAMQPPNEPPRDLSSEDIFLELFILDVPRLAEGQNRNYVDRIRQLEEENRQLLLQAEQARRQSPEQYDGLVHKLREEIALLKTQAFEQQRQLAAAAAASHLGPLGPQSAPAAPAQPTGRVNDPRSAAACCPLARAGTGDCLVS